MALTKSMTHRTAKSAEVDRIRFGTDEADVRLARITLVAGVALIVTAIAIWLIGSQPLTTFPAICGFVGGGILIGGILAVVLMIAGDRDDESIDAEIEFMPTDMVSVGYVCVHCGKTVEFDPDFSRFLGRKIFYDPDVREVTADSVNDGRWCTARDDVDFHEVLAPVVTR